MRKIRLTIEYDGTGFHGWQRQGRRRTVQAAVERAVRRVTGRRVNVHASGRTDAGVHAEGQVAVFCTDSTIPAERFCLALTSHLPEGVAIVRSEEVPMTFNPQRDARGKRYRYVFLVRPSRAARIFAVVDVWDALRSDRPYRPAWPEEKVREHIRAGVGTHFDPQVMEVFLKMQSEGEAG